MMLPEEKNRQKKLTHLHYHILNESETVFLFRAVVKLLGKPTFHFFQQLHCSVFSETMWVQ